MAEHHPEVIDVGGGTSGRARFLIVAREQATFDRLAAALRSNPSLELVACDAADLSHLVDDRGSDAVLVALSGGDSSAELAETFPQTVAPPTEGSGIEVQEVIEERRYAMVFQPVVALHGGELLGLEALARFTSEPRRSPDVWLREAEAVGLRCELEEGLLRAALADVAHLPSGAFMTVNLSPEVVLSGALGRTIPASLLPRVVVEITDHQEVSDYGALAESLAEARAGGLRVAVDDSGQSLSTLHEVLRLAPDFIKLNRALVRDIDRDPTRRALVFALHSVAAQVGASVIAEGIETSAELQALRSLGIVYGQGYLIGRPEPLAEAASPVTLPDGPAEATPRPPIVLAGRAMRTFRDASRAAFRLLERELPGSSIIAAQLDYRAQSYRVLAASDSLAGQLDPGFTLPLAQSLCAHMASGRAPRVSPDVADDRVYGTLALPSQLGISSYVGVPLEVEGTGRVASLCAIAPDPDRYGQDTLEILQAVAVVLLRALEDELTQTRDASVTDWLRTVASTDELTGTLNRLTFLEKLEAEARGQTGRYPTKFAAHVELDGISGVQEQYGRTVGELVIKGLADALIGAARAGDSAGRLGEAEFGVVLVNRQTPEQAAYHCELVGERLREAFAKRGVVVKARAGTAPLDGTRGGEALAIARTSTKPIA